MASSWWWTARFRAKGSRANFAMLIWALTFLFIVLAVLRYWTALQRAMTEGRGTASRNRVEVAHREARVSESQKNDGRSSGGDDEIDCLFSHGEPYASWVRRTWLVDDDEASSGSMGTSLIEAANERAMTRYSLIERGHVQEQQRVGEPVVDKTSRLTRFRSIALALNRTTGHRRLTWPLYENKLGRELAQWFTSQISPLGSKLLRSLHWCENPTSSDVLQALTEAALDECAALHHVVHWSLLKHSEPQLVYVHRAVTPWVCNALIRLGNASLARSTVVLDAAETSEKVQAAKVVDPVRTSYGTFLTSFADRTHPANVAYRVAAAYLLGVPESHLEPTQILKYTVGQQYRPHLDYFDPNDEVEVRRGGQRVATVLLWLNDNVQGGETSFPAGALALAPRRGDAVIFYNVLDDEGMPTDRTAVHAGLPPLSGEKWVAVLWAHPRIYEASTLG